MKKIFPSLALLSLIAGGAYAQKTIDLEVTQVLAPTANEALPNCNNNDSVLFAVEIKNNGTDAVSTDDTIFFNVQGEGVATDGVDDYTLYNAFSGYSIAAGAVDTVSFWINQGANYGNSANGPVKTNFPSNAADTFVMYVYGRDVNGAAFTDVGYDPTASPKLDINGNNLGAVAVTFGSTGITAVNYTKTALNVFPNPANGNVNVKYNFTNNTEATIRVVDVTGRTVITNNLGKQAVGERTFNVNTSNLANGIYTIQLVTDNARAISKLTIAK